jgi:NADH:ubiquinone oxidoreductase subunit E
MVYVRNETAQSEALMPPNRSTSSPAVARKHIYRGDPIAEAPPAELATILERHLGAQDALMTVLEEIQRHYGYLGQDQLRYVARTLQFPLARVYGVATFYNLFRFDPPGKYQVRVCRGTACHVNHSAAILRYLCDQLGIDVGETTADGRFTLQTVACMGACSLAPVLVVDDATYGRMTSTSAWEALLALDADAAGESHESLNENG